MKKMLLSSVLGLAALAMWAAPSHAWTFGLIPYHCWPCGGKCDKCCGTICVRPYNAFSPSASGTMCFDGCNPFCCPRNPGYPGAVPPGPGYDNLPPADACPEAAPSAPDAPAAPCAPPAAPTPGMGMAPMPYGGPLQAAGLYGAAPMMPPTGMPMPAQPYYGTPGR